MKILETTVELPKQPNGFYMVENDRNIYSVCDGCWYCHTPAQYKVFEDTFGPKVPEVNALVKLKEAGFSVDDIMRLRKEGLI